MTSAAFTVVKNLVLNTIVALTTLVFATLSLFGMAAANADSQSFETISAAAISQRLPIASPATQRQVKKTFMQAGFLCRPLRHPLFTQSSRRIRKPASGAGPTRNSSQHCGRASAAAASVFIPPCPIRPIPNSRAKTLWAIRTFLATLGPVKNAVDVNRLPFPFNQRSSLIVWNWLNFKDGRFQPDAQKSAEWNRGAYVVEALGHCGTCHTGKNFLGGDKNENYLQGAALQGWFAPNITADPHKGIGAWSENEIVEYLKTGSNDRSIASGPMADEIVHSSSQMNDADARAIAIYLKDIKSSTGTPPPPLDPDDARMIAGRAILQG